MCTIEDELNIDFIDESKHVLAMFLNQELFWINDKTVINSAFVSYEELWRSRRVLFASAYGLDG